MADSTSSPSDPHNLRALEQDPRLFLYTSLTAGSSHIITATSRMETILKANRIPFQAIDLATDEQARRLWQRRGGGKKKLPGLVKEGYIIGDIDEVEEWNEFGELKENIGPVPAHNAPVPAGGPIGINTAPPLSHNAGPAAQAKIAAEEKKIADKGTDTERIALPGAAEIAAMQKAKMAEKAKRDQDARTVAEEEKKAADTKAAGTTASGDKVAPETKDSAAAEKKASISLATDVAAEKKDDAAAGEQTVTSPRTIRFKGEEEFPLTTTATAEDEQKKQHRGSQIIDAPPAEIKMIESETSLAEVEGEEDGDAEQERTAAAKALEGLKIADEDQPTKTEEKTQQQDAKDGKKAGDSVED